MQSVMKRRTWIFLSLACLTLLLGVYYDPFIEASPSLMENGNFSAGLQSWKIHAGTHGQVQLAEDGSVLLRLRDAEKSVGLRQEIDTSALQHRGLRLSGTIRTRQVVAGQKPWQKARVMMNTIEPEGARVRSYNTLAGIVGTQGWKEYQKDFSVAADIAQVVIVAQLPRATGEMWVKDLRLVELARQPAYPLIQGLVFLTWALFFADLLVFLLGDNKRLTILLVLGLCALLFVGTQIPQGWKTKAVAGVTGWGETLGASVQVSMRQVQALWPPRTGADLFTQERAPIDGGATQAAPVLSASKAAHLAFFGLISLVLFAGVKHLSPLWLFAAMMMLACATELLQLFSPGRTPRMTDVLIDALGILAGALAYLGWRFAKRITKASPRIC